MASFQGVASFHDVLNMYPQNITVWLKFSVQDIYIYIANCGAIAVIASTTYMTVVNTLPPSPEMTMIVIDHDTNIYIE